MYTYYIYYQTDDLLFPHFVIYCYTSAIIITGS